MTRSSSLAWKRFRTIRYQYHYHVDVSGNQPHTEKSDTAGGCYTGTHGHVHSVEDGCYKEESYHVHRDDCSGYPVWVDWAPGVEPYWGFIYTCGEPANATRRVLICSKQAGSTDYYVPSCGLADGQIIGAEIVYDQAHAQVKAQEEQQCRDELVRLALSMQPALGSNTSETEQIGTDADNIPPAPEQIAAEAERKRQEEAAAEAERRQESEGEVKTEADRARKRRRSKDRSKRRQESEASCSRCRPAPGSWRCIEVRQQHRQCGHIQRGRRRLAGGECRYTEVRRQHRKCEYNRHVRYRQPENI
ncbi:MAG: hypothetical protein ACLURV_04585 [Gallintestinimicrobium sp.]